MYPQNDYLKDSEAVVTGARQDQPSKDSASIGISPGRCWKASGITVLPLVGSTVFPPKTDSNLVDFPEDELVPWSQSSTQL